MMKTSTMHELQVIPVERLTDGPLPLELAALEQELWGDSERMLRVADALGAAVGLPIDMRELSRSSLNVIADPAVKQSRLGWASFGDEGEGAGNGGSEEGGNRESGDEESVK